MKFGESYARAKQVQLEPIVSQLILKPRDSSKDFYIDNDGKKCINYAHLQRMRMELDNIKWYASKLAPKIYGERIHKEVEATGSLVEKLIDKL
jgi:hypothetical protein